jgi:hypothetical protein
MASKYKIALFIYTQNNIEKVEFSTDTPCRIKHFAAQVTNI